MLKIELPTPFAVGPVNVYFFPQDEPTLMDTGPMGEDSLAALRRALREIGFDIPDIKKIYISHGHLDHFGQGALLREMSGATVYAHPGEYVRIEHDPGGRLSAQKEITYPLLRDFGLPEAVIEGMADFSKVFRRYARVLLNTVPLEEGEVHRFGNLEMEVIHCPGHARGLVCFYNRARGFLMANDHLIKHITPNPVMELPSEPGGERPKSLWTYLRSLRKVRKLKPRLVYSGHGVEIDDADALIEFYFQHHQRRQQHILAHLQNGGKSVYELCTLLFPKLETGSLYLGLSEIIGHLDILEMQGMVQKVSGKGSSRYLPIAA